MDAPQPQREISYRAEVALEQLARLSPGVWITSRLLADRIVAVARGVHLGNGHQTKRRRIREIVAELKRAGVPVVGHSSHGIRLALSEADAEVHWRRVSRLAKTAFVMGRRVRQAAQVEPTGRQRELF